MIVARGVPVYPFIIPQTETFALKKQTNEQRKTNNQKNKTKKNPIRSMPSSKITRFVQEYAFANQVKPRADGERAMDYF